MSVKKLINLGIKILYKPDKNNQVFFITSLDGISHSLNDNLVLNNNTDYKFIIHFKNSSGWKSTYFLLTNLVHKIKQQS